MRHLRLFMYPNKKGAKKPLGLLNLVFSAICVMTLDPLKAQTLLIER